MESIKDILDRKLGKSVNPVQDIIAQPKHEVKMTVIKGGSDAPLDDDDLPPQENPYTKPIDELDGPSGDNPISIKGDKTINFSKQADKLVKAVNPVQAYIFAIIADVEDIEQFKFDKEEIEAIMIYLPDSMEEHGITVSDDIGLGITLAMIVLKRARKAMKMRKDKKDEEERQRRQIVTSKPEEAKAAA